MRMRKSVCELHLLKGELIYTLQMDHSPQNMCNEPTVVVKDAVIIDIHTITDTTIKPPTEVTETSKFSLFPKNKDIAED
eukprot:m.199029 g.199029  ORF g.199029 m.199029 type:complete len:79 (+) comp15722_c1_seq10:357-593(+)